MSTNESGTQTLMRRHLVVLHPSRPAVLVDRSPAGVLRLPFQDEPDGDPRQVGAIAGRLGTGLELASLGEFGAWWPEPDRAVDGIESEYLMLCEFREPPAEAELERYDWSTSEGDVELHPELEEALAELFRWLADPATPDGDSQIALLPPHCLPGATAALDRVLRGALMPEPTAGSGSAPTPYSGLSGFEQLQAWVLSNVWLSDGQVAKVTTPLWPQEPAVTELLHTWAPTAVPPVLARGELSVPGAGRPAPWMLSRRYRPASPEREPASAAVLEALARLQAIAVGREHELLQAGAPERGPLAVAGELGILWEEAARAGLSAAELSQLPRLEEWLVRRLRALAAVAPSLLTHGDFHPGNALNTLDMVPELRPGEAHSGRSGTGTGMHGPRTVIFDWTDAALAWPGVDILTMAPHGLSREQRPADLLVVKGKYLNAARAAFGHPDHAELLRAIEASVDEGLELALVYHAVSYAHIVRSVPEKQKPFVGSRFLVRSVRQLLEQLEKAPA